MKKLVTILVFALCTLMMLEYAQAGDCRKYGQRGIVYVLLEGSTPNKKANYYKIGASGSDELLKSRMRNMQAGNFRKLHLVARFYMTNCKAAEDDAHELFKQSRMNGGGGTEWFRVPLINQANKAFFELLKKELSRPNNKYKLEKMDFNKLPNEAVSEEDEESDEDSERSDTTAHHFLKFVASLLD